MRNVKKHVHRGSDPHSWEQQRALSERLGVSCSGAAAHGAAALGNGMPTHGGFVAGKWPSVAAFGSASTSTSTGCPRDPFHKSMGSWMIIGLPSWQSGAHGWRRRGLQNVVSGARISAITHQHGLQCNTAESWRDWRESERARLLKVTETRRAARDADDRGGKRGRPIDPASRRQQQNAERAERSGPVCRA